MPHDSELLSRTIGINEGKPYQSTLVPRENDQCKTPGISIFQVENGTVSFEFYPDQEMQFPDYHSFMQAIGEAMQGTHPLDIVVPSADLRSTVLVTGLPSDPHGGRTVNGVLAESAIAPASSFGLAGQSIKRVTVDLLDIPSGWGNPELLYQYATLKHPLQFSEDYHHIEIPTATMGTRTLSGCTINAGKWTVEIQEIPSERRRNQRVTHWCTITRNDESMTGTSAWEFFEEEFWPFLCFMFAHNVQVTHMAGAGWIKFRAVRAQAILPIRENWLLLAGYRSINLETLFQKFHNQDAETKKHWRKVIDRYATSEEIIATLGDPEIAEAVSFAGLEGLTRSIISGYDDKSQWLTNNLELKRKRRQNGERAGIADAIEMVLDREMATETPNLNQTLTELAKLRNSTMHTDLRSDPDQANAYYRWNASQALIEALLLNKMGLERIPNRTAYPTFAIMGLDVYKDVRKETILPHQCQSCGEWTGTLRHDGCNQNLCSECWEHHNQAGCAIAIYSATQ